MLPVVVLLFVIGGVNWYFIFNEPGRAESMLCDVFK
jgi:hypothetical protein